LSGRWIWVGALALTLAVLALHSVVRLRQVEAVTERRVGAGLAPEADAGSPTGYRWGEHRLVLPETDSYLWLLQAEEALASGVLRVREAGYDNAPEGREVHWAAFERWWLIGVASAYGLVHPELTAARSLERVAPWANTLLLGIFLLALTPLVAVRLGAVPAAVLCAGCVAVFPFYEYVRVGYVDHHGPAVLFSVASTCASSSVVRDGCVRRTNGLRRRPRGLPRPLPHAGGSSPRESRPESVCGSAPRRWLPC
jgi:hypothetical protein